MKITLLTTSDLKHHITEEELLISELKARGHQAELIPWETLKDNGSDLFLVRTTWNYTDHLDAFLEKLKIVKDRLLNPYDLITWNSNKKYLLELQEKGHPIMPLELVYDETSLASGIKKLGGDEFVVKPLVGASAIGLKRFTKNAFPEIADEMILQKFYPEITSGEISMFFFRGEFGYAVKKVPKEGDIRVQEEYGSTIDPYDPLETELDIARKITKELPPNWLYARVDLVPDIGVIELECIEPSLYYSKVPNSVNLFADAIEKHFLLK